MQSRAHTNPYPDYINAHNMYIHEGDSVDKELLDKIDDTIKELIKPLEKELKQITCHAEYSVYTGYCGVAHLFYLKGIKDNDEEAMDTALEACNLAIKNLKKKRVCYLNGDAGPICLAAIIYRLKRNTKNVRLLAEKLEYLWNLLKDDSSMPDELLYGKGGYLYSLLLANRHLGDELISPQIVRMVVEKILRSGKRLSKSRNGAAPMMFEWHEKNYLGAAHGLAGILYVILLARSVLKDEELNEVVRPTLDWLLTQRFPSGNFLSSEGSVSDRLVQWCHGAPGFVHLLTLASQVYNCKEYMDMALDCGEVIWQRGLLCKGYSLCHGVAGNGYAFLHLYKTTKDPKHLHRAACFAHWCTKFPKHQGMEPDRPYSLYEGLAGMLHFLIDFKEPLESSFPAFSF